MTTRLTGVSWFAGIHDGVIGHRILDSCVLVLLIIIYRLNFVDSVRSKVFKIM